MVDTEDARRLAGIPPLHDGPFQPLCDRLRLCDREPRVIICKGKQASQSRAVHCIAFMSVISKSVAASSQDTTDFIKNYPHCNRVSSMNRKIPILIVPIADEDIWSCIVGGINETCTNEVEKARCSQYLQFHLVFGSVIY